MTNTCLSTQVLRAPLQAPTVLVSKNRLGRKPKLSWCCLQVAVATISTIVAPNFLVYCGLRFLSSVGWSGLLLTSTMLSESLDRPPRPRRGGEEGAQGHGTWPSPECPPRLAAVEWTTTRMRAVTVTMMACSYGVGQMALGATAFALRDWRPIQLAVSVPFFVIFLISWSVQWGAFSLGENITEWKGDLEGVALAPAPLIGHGS